jgi:farnesyl-diphosphate farnesyltransferase
VSPSDDFCRRILPEVSRTFALNIPVLPAPLEHTVTVAYLLCRIADTLEDEARGPAEDRAGLLAELAALVALTDGWRARAPAFTQRALAAIRDEAAPAERELLAHTAQVLDALAGLPDWARPPITRCVREMTRGMALVARTRSADGVPTGLPDLEATLTYCYYVAGTVGEMLTALFVEYSDRAARRVGELAPRAQSFGRALQLTNILRDVREDLERGSCWLPRPMMEAHGLTPRTLLLAENRAQAVALLDELIGVARREVERAFEYALALPVEEPGLRLFCLWPLFFAVLTLGALRGNPAVFDTAGVKIGRLAVARIMGLTRERVASDAALRTLFAGCIRPLGEPRRATS